MNPDLRKISALDDTHKDLMGFSKVLEGMHRHASTHAAGVVITPGPLTDYVPLFKNPSESNSNSGSFLFKQNKRLFLSISIEKVKAINKNNKILFDIVQITPKLY